MRAFVIAIVALADTGCDRVFRLDDLVPASDATSAYPVIACEPPVPVLATPPSNALAEPGFDITGHALLVRLFSNLRELRRASLSSPFGPPGDVTVIDPAITDPTFVTIGGAVVAFGSVRPMPRHIAICRDPSATSVCERITIIDDATGTAIADDHDGPAVGVRDGVPVMVFSRGSALYAATPAAADLSVWTASRLALGDVVTDDAALTTDGRVLIVPVAGGLVALHWDEQAATFVAPQFLSIGGASPTLFEQGQLFELVITRSDRGVLEPYLAPCSRG